MHEKTCSRLLIAAFYVIAQHLKQPKYLSVGKWINELGHSHPQSTVHIEENELAQHISSWVKLNNSIGQRKQLQKNII